MKAQNNQIRGFHYTFPRADNEVIRRSRRDQLVSFAARVCVGNSVTSCDLGIFMDQVAEAIPAPDTHTGHFSW